MSAAALMNVAPTRSPRLLAAVHAREERDDVGREPALDRLEAALGRDFADRLVASLAGDDRAEPDR
jgi:hypothetical protein